MEPHGQEPVAPAVWRNPPKLQSSFAKASEDTRIPPRPGDRGFLRRRVKNRKNLFLLPHHSEYFHPDLVTASDALIGKVGYSTLAEVYSAGMPFGYIARSDFRESRVLVSYIENHMQGFAIEDREFYEGSFLSRLTELLSLQRVERHTQNGAEQAARFILNLMKEIGA